MLKQKLHQDQLTALKTGDKIKLNLIRYILAKIKNKEIDKHKDLDEVEIVEILRKVNKELHESLLGAEKANRPELITQAKTELTIVSGYLPKELSDEELTRAIQTIIANNQAIYDKNPKAIIGICIKELRGKADSQRIIALLNSLSPRHET